MSEYKSALYVKSEAVDARVIRFRASGSNPDRDGDVLLAKGWKLDNYKNNPVFLWAHQGREPPVGKTIDIFNTDNELVQDVQFAAKGSDYDEWPTHIPSPDTLLKLYKNGFLNAVSVGFMPIKWANVEDENTRNQLGLGRWGVLFEEQELLELSSVTVPSNPNALRLAVSSGLIESKDLQAFQSPEEQLVTQIKSFMRSYESGQMSLVKALDKIEALVVKAESQKALETVEPVAEKPEPLADFKKLWETMGKSDIIKELEKVF